MKKTLLTIFTVLILKSTGFAQIKKYSLIGVWQVEYPQLGDAWLANYRFFSNGTFKYTFNQYDDRGRIAAAKGIFKLHGDTLTLIIKTRIERIGGDLVGGRAVRAGNLHRHNLCTGFRGLKTWLAQDSAGASDSPAIQL